MWEPSLNREFLFSIWAGFHGQLRMRAAVAFAVFTGCYRVAAQLEACAEKNVMQTKSRATDSLTSQHSACRHPPDGDVSRILFLVLLLSLLISENYYGEVKVAAHHIIHSPMS